MSDLAKEYGGALFELAEDEGLTLDILNDVRIIRKVLLDNPLYVKFLTSPNISIEERINGVEKAFGNAKKYTLNFLKIMTEFRYGDFLVETFDVYEMLFYKKNNIVKADIESAVELTEKQQEVLKKNLEKKLGKKVELNIIVDPSLIGGLRVTANGERFEGSIRGKLEELRNKLAETIL